MHTIPANHTTFAFRPDTPPVLRVRPGETVRLETSPAPAERLLAAGARWLDLLDTRALNAVTGPVFIDTVHPGDAVAVEILAIDTLDWAWTAAIPNFGLLNPPDLPPTIRRLPIRDDRVHLSDRLSLRLRPMIGCLGLAPATGESSTLAPPYPWGGNYDLAQLAPGATLLLPAQVPGGLFSLGDLHAAMGHGEPTSVALECAGAATVRLDVRKNLRLPTPRLETPTHLHTIGLAPKGDYPAAKRQAIALMYAHLTTDRHLSPTDAHALLSAAVDLSFGGPAGAIALASLPCHILD